MSTPTHAAALHDLRAAQALIERALTALGEPTTAPPNAYAEKIREPVKKPPRFLGSASTPDPGA